MVPLEIDDVARSFGDRVALAGVSLELAAGETMGLLGPNGAGKSTLVKTIMGRLVPDRGAVRIFGVDAKPGDMAARERVGVVPQEIALYPLLSARENLLVFGRYLGLSGNALRDAIDRALDWAALTDRAHDVSKNLSGGMRRRLNMAVGILHEPRILLLDEPTVGVDPQSRERIYEMIGGLRSDGVSIIYTTHYMEEAERLCDRIAVIDHGSVIAQGTKDELVRSTIGTGREVTIEIETELPSALRDRLRALKVEIEGEKLRLFTDHPGKALGALFGELETYRVGVRDMTLKAPTLESVFLHLTGRELRE